VIGLYYYGEVTMKEIGIEIGVNESRVSQLHARAIRRLRATLDEAGVPMAQLSSELVAFAPKKAAMAKASLTPVVGLPAQVASMEDAVALEKTGAVVLPYAVSPTRRSAAPASLKPARTRQMIAASR